ncbi:MAG: RluA family pseudouridine synthase [Prevotella sp.]|nr:RluA family pseudouridine synthase [Prevotella sp.]
MTVVYEDNHIIIVSKESGEIVQGDKTGDVTLADMVKAYIKEQHHKAGNVFLGVVHRLDRPVAGLVIFAKTSKALTRMSEMFRDGKVNKTYLALTRNAPPKDHDTIFSWLVRDEKRNKSYSYAKEVPGAKMAIMQYRLLGTTENYHLLEVRLLTGRHHQIRCQLASIGCPIRGDLKYGARRSNPDGSISLLSHRIEFVHPVSGNIIDIVAPLPDEPIWQGAEQLADDRTPLTAI